MEKVSLSNQLNSKANILIVDDDVLIAESIRFLIKKAGYNSIGIAVSGAQAIELAKEKQPNLILMDINLGDSIGGITAATEIQEFADIPFIFLTAYSDPATIEKAKKVGPFGYLIKPFDNREVLVAIETALYKHSFDKKIKEQELLFRTVANHAYEWESWLSPDLQFKYCSPSCERVTGFKDIEFMNNPHLLSEIVHPDDKEIFENHITKFHSEKIDETVEGFEFRINHKFGKVKHIRHTCISIIDEKDNYLGRRVTNVDITERMEAQEALKESEVRYRRLVDNAPISIAVYQNGVFVFVNTFGLKLMGASSPADLLGKSVLEIVHPDSLNEVGKRMLLVANSSEVPAFEERLIKLDGIIFDAEVTASSTLFNGKPAAQVIVKDITERKLIENELKKYREHLEDIVEERTLELTSSEERFKKLSELSKDSISRIDRNYKLCYANSILASRWGTKIENILGKSFKELGAPIEIVNVEEAAIKKVFTTGKECRIELNLPSGKWIDWYLVPEFNALNEVETVLGFGRDITEIKNLQENIQKAFEKEKELNEIKTNFVSFASHEFRTPLTSIQSSTDLLKLFGRTWSEEKYNKYLSQIGSSVDEMTHMLNQVLTLNKAEKGKQKFEVALIPLRSLIEEVLKNIETLPYFNHNVEVIYNIQNNEFWLDGEIIKRILNNLVSNSVKYSPSESSITLSISQQENYLHFNVQDYGIGIPKNELKNIFEPFHRASNVGSAEGSGLGLAIVKQMVELHKGTMSVESEIKKGTKILFSINIEKD